MVRTEMLAYLHAVPDDALTRRLAMAHETFVVQDTIALLNSEASPIPRHAASHEPRRRRLAEPDLFSGKSLGTKASEDIPASRFISRQARPKSREEASLMAQPDELSPCEAPTKGQEIATSHHTSILQYSKEHVGQLKDVAYPSEPIVSDLDASATLLPSALHTFLDRQTISLEYAKSARATRELHRLERGAWVVTLTHLSRVQMDELWTSIKRFVQDNTCGWSVTSYRYMADRAKVVDGKHVIATTLLTFCFGELAIQILAVLDALSEGQIRSVAPCWVDDNGIAVLTLES